MHYPDTKTPFNSEGGAGKLIRNSLRGPIVTGFVVLNDRKI